MPTIKPLSPSSMTTGKSTCERPTVSVSRDALNLGPVKSGMTTPGPQHEEGRDGPEHQQHDPEERGRQPEGVAAAVLLEQIREHRHEGR